METLPHCIQVQFDGEKWIITDDGQALVSIAGDCPSTIDKVGYADKPADVAMIPVYHAPDGLYYVQYFAYWIYED